MNQSALCLDDAEVEELLSGEMASERTSELEQHLTACVNCREKLVHQVGDEGWWCDTQSSLRTGMLSERPSGTNEDSPERLLELLGPTDDPNMLGRIGAYEITGLLGQGGMGAVFKGFDRSLNRFVAIKMLLPHLAASGAARKRFAREGQAVAAVVDDHVMAIHCVDEWQGVPYLVMTYSRGVSLQRRLQENGALEVREILRIGMQAAKGLAAAHSQGIVHRDIKPANFFLDDNVERVQLMDFGLARAVDDASLTRSGTLAGTPQYMSPEQARAETVDHRSDLFSLGSVLYAICVGHAPFRADTSYGVLRLITDKEPRPIRETNAEIPDWLCAMIEKLMSKQPGERFESANEVSELLESCLAHVQHPTTTPLPSDVAELVKSFSTRSKTHTDGSLDDSRCNNGKPPFIKWLAAATFGFSFLLAGVLIVLEMNKGTLTIESDADNVPIRITQGDEVVKQLTVAKGSKSVRIKSGKYVVEIEGEFDGVAVKNGNVSLSRHTTETVKVIQEKTEALAHDSMQQSDQSDVEWPVIKLDGVYDPATFVPLDKDPGEVDVSYLRTIEDITARYNKMTRPLRRELFINSIDDLNTEQFRAAMLYAAEQYSRRGKEHVALALTQSVKDNQLASSLTFTGMTGSTSDRFRQIAPSFIWHNGTSGRLVVLSKVELRYSRDGWSSPAWGDIHPPITGKWNLASVKADDELLGEKQFNDWKLGNAHWSNLAIGDGTIRMASDELTTYEFTLNHNAFPQKFRISHEAENKFEGVFMGTGFGDNNTLEIAVDVSGESSPKTFHTKDGRTTLLTYHRAEIVAPTLDSEVLDADAVSNHLNPAAEAGAHSGTRVPETPWADFSTEDPSFGLNEEVEALSSLNAEFREMEATYRKAIDQAADEAEFSRVRNELDPREIMPSKYLAFEETHRGNHSGLKALKTVARIAKGEFDLAANAHKGFVEARRRVSTHYLNHRGLESIADLFERWPFYVEPDGFLQTLADKSPHRETRAKAMLAQIVQGKDLLIHESELPAKLGEMVIDEEDSPQFNERLRNCRKQLEDMDFKQLRADLNEKLKRLADSYSDVIVENYGTAGMAAHRLGHAINRVIVGAKAPEITATDINGKDFRLSKLRGKVVVLLFAEHEDDYKEMFGPLRQLVAKYDAAPVEFVGIMSNSHPANLLAASERGDLPWTVIAQPPHNAPLQLDWGIDRDGPVYIVDKQGILQPQLHMPYYGDGGYDAHAVGDKISALLKKPYFRPSAAPTISASPSPALSPAPFKRSDAK